MSEANSITKSLTPEFRAILSKIEEATAITAYNFRFLSDASISRLRNIYAIFCFSNLILFTVLTWLSLLQPAKNPIDLLLQLAVSGGVLTAVNIAYDIKFHKKEIESIFIWIGKLQQKHPQEFERPIALSHKIIKYCRVFFIVTVWLIYVLESVYYLLFGTIWNENGAFVVKLPFVIHLPGIKIVGWTSFWINWAFGIVGEGMTGVTCIIFLGIITMLTVFFEAAFNVVNGDVMNLSDEFIRCQGMSGQVDAKFYKQRISNIISLHDDVTR